MFKIVKKCEIEVIKPSELKVGDNILWANWKRKVVKINKLNRFITVTNPVNDTTEGLVFFMNYYRILSCEEVDYNEK